MDTNKHILLSKKLLNDVLCSFNLISGIENKRPSFHGRTLVTIVTFKLTKGQNLIRVFKIEEDIAEKLTGLEAKARCCGTRCLSLKRGGGASCGGRGGWWW